MKTIALIVSLLATGAAAQTQPILRGNPYQDKGIAQQNNMVLQQQQQQRQLDQMQRQQDQFQEQMRQQQQNQY